LIIRSFGRKLFKGGRFIHNFFNKDSMLDRQEKKEFSPMQTLNGFLKWQWEDTMMNRCFYGKIGIKLWNIGRTIPLQNFLYGLLIQL
jgi:hypothetical protein